MKLLPNYCLILKTLSPNLVAFLVFCDTELSQISKMFASETVANRGLAHAIFSEKVSEIIYFPWAENVQ